MLSPVNFKTGIIFKIKRIQSIKGKLYIDDSAINDIPWGTGWMWDDENNPYMPKYNSYNIDRNTNFCKSHTCPDK